MLKYIKKWIDSAKQSQKELNDMGIVVVWSPLPMNPVNPYYIDKERYKNYINDKQRQVSKSNNQSQK